MRPVIATGIILLLGCVGHVWAQDARIVEMKGQVLVRPAAKGGWVKAQYSMALEQQSQIMTKSGAECTVAFDEQLKSLATVKEKSLVTLQDLSMDRQLSLARGELFLMVDMAGQPGRFEVRTPTAVAGARGTSWSVGMARSETSVACYEDTVYVVGLDKRGDPTAEVQIDFGQGIEIGPGGQLGELIDLPVEEMREWGQRRDQLVVVREMELTQSKGMDAASVDKTADGPGVTSSASASSKEQGGAISGAKGQDAAFVPKEASGLRQEITNKGQGMSSDGRDPQERPDQIPAGDDERYTTGIETAQPPVPETFQEPLDPLEPIDDSIMTEPIVGDDFNSFTDFDSSLPPEDVFINDPQDDIIKDETTEQVTDQYPPPPPPDSTQNEGGSGTIELPPPPP